MKRTFAPLASFLVAASTPCFAGLITSVTDFSADEGFSSGPLHGQEGWRNPVGEAFISPEKTFAADQAVWLAGWGTGTVVRRDFTGFHGEPVVFVDLFVKPGLNDPVNDRFEVRINGAAAAILRQGNQGVLHVWKNHGRGPGQWLKSDVEVPLDEAWNAQSWHRLSFGLDRENQVYQVYFDNHPVEFSVPMGSSGASNETVGLEIAAPADSDSWVDSVFVSNEDPLAENSGPGEAGAGTSKDRNTENQPGAYPLRNGLPGDTDFSGNRPEHAGEKGLDRARDRAGEALGITEEPDVELRVFTPLE